MDNMLRIALASLLFLGFLCLITLPVLAADNFEIPNPVGKDQTFEKVLARVIDFALKLLPAVATLMTLVAAFLYLTSGGNEERVKAAHRALIYTIIGIAIVLLAKGAELIVRDLLTPNNSTQPSGQITPIDCGPFGSAC